jgi:hypothetical protein
MTFGTWNVMSLYLSGSLTTIARELARNKLGFCVCVYRRCLLGGRGKFKRRGLCIIPWKKEQQPSIGNRIVCTKQNIIGN